MIFAKVILGVLLLILGRKLYWFFVAASGFIAGLMLATRVLHIEQEGVALLIALGIGLLGALLAYFLQHVAIVVAGIILGGLLAQGVASSIGLTGAPAQIGALILGAIVGAVLMHWVFEWGLILLSSLVGAALVVQGLNLAGGTKSLAGVVLPIVGIVIQASMMRRGSRQGA